MPSIRVKSKFPCGSEIEYEAKTMNPFADMDFNENGNVCPLHGKSCPQGKAIEK